MHVKDARSYRIAFVGKEGLHQSSIVVAFHESHARELFLELGAQHDREAQIIGVERISEGLPMFTDSGPFQRIDHGQLHFPVPALAIPLSDCDGQRGAESMGFERFSERDPTAPLPLAESLLAIVPNDHEIAVYIRHPGSPLYGVERPSLEIEFSDRHPAAWLQGIFATGKLALFASPTDWSRYDTIGAALIASWVLLLSIPSKGHGIATPSVAQ